MPYLFDQLRTLNIRIRSFWWSLWISHGSVFRVLGRIVVISPQNLKVGDFVTLNEGVFLNARAEIFIGDHVHISPHVVINTGFLKYNEGIGQDRTHQSLPVYIEQGVWVGSGAIINPGVRIGQNSVIGSGAVVTKDIPENTVAVGVPAKVIKSISASFEKNGDET